MKTIPSSLKLMLAAAIAVLALAPRSALAATTTETFDTGLGQFDAAVGNTDGGNNFGFSNTGNAAGTPGEIGGTFSQNAVGYVADTTLNGTHGWADRIVIRARVRTRAGGDDQVAILGYFNATGAASDGARGNIMAGIGFIGSGPRMYLLLDGNIESVTGVPNDAPFDVDLALTYDPGTARATWAGTVAGAAVSTVRTVNDPARTASAFGVTSGFASGSPNNAESFFDNLVYSVKGQAGPPAFTTDPIVKVPARVGTDYSAASATLAVNAEDPANDPLQFAKTSGPAWLMVASDGALSGTPTAGDIGLNSWTVTVTDGTDTDTATLQINVVSAAGAIVVSGTEDWDGLQNPHAGEGVTLSGAGTEGDPAVYTIPSGLTIAATGVLRMPPALGQDRSIRLLFASGDLHFEAGGVINVGRLNRNGRQTAHFDLGGGNITGQGTLLGLLHPNDSPRVTTIQNVVNVSLAIVDLHVVNANNSGRHFTVIADGTVNIGSIDNSDKDPGGNTSSDVVIRAASIEVGAIDTRALRASGTGGNGHVILEALGPPGFDPNAAFDNSFQHRLLLKGLIHTAGVGPNGGNITLRGVRVLLFPGFLVSKAANGTLALEAGVLDQGAPASDLFLNLSSLPLTPSHAVQWAGNVAPGQAPAFNNDLVQLAAGAPNTAYSGTLAGTATDPDNSPLTFIKGQGPAWLQIAPDGTLSGTPTDSGINSWTIAVTDGTRYDTATLRIPISGRPSFLTDPILKPNGFQGMAYSATLAGTAADPDNDPLTFAKVDGPAWLNVAANGALSGTPGSADTFTNRWTVSVSDGVGSSTATLIIIVGGAPRFRSNPVVKGAARVGNDYGAAANTLAADAADPEGNAITFAKVSGPTWLQVAADGALSGTPAAADVGPNSWTVSASDGMFTSQVTLQILVNPAEAPIEITGTENWDGVENPHAADGVTLTGAGLVGDPAVYTIPSGLLIRPTGLIRTVATPGTDKSIQFTFASGHLQMDAGAVINIGQLNRNGRNTFVLDLGGGNITGEGRIVGIRNRDDAPRIMTIQNVTDVSLAEMDLHVDNANTSRRNLRINADGVVRIPRIDNSDQDPGGNDSSDISIRASRIEVGALDTRAIRPGGATRNGDIQLIALGAPGFDPGNAADNGFRHKLILSGAARTAGAGTSGGQVTLQGVVVQFQPGFSLQKPEPATLVLQAGMVQGDATAADLFVDAAGSGLIADHSVQWSGDIEPTLAVARNGSNVEINWNGTGFILQENSNLANPAGWTDITDGTVNTATRPLTGGQKFYRARK